MIGDAAERIRVVNVCIAEGVPLATCARIIGITPDVIEKHLAFIGKAWPQRKEALVISAPEAAEPVVNPAQPLPEKAPEKPARRKEPPQASRWTGADGIEFRRMWAEGKPAIRIAERFKITDARVYQLVKKMGLPPRTAKSNPETPAQRKPWTKHGLDKLRALWAEGVPLMEIADEIHHPPEAVSAKAREIGLPPRTRKRHTFRLQAKPPPPPDTSELGRAKLHLQRLGHVVYAAHIDGGPKDKIRVDGRLLSRGEVMAVAIDKGFPTTQQTGDKTNG